MPLPAVDEQLVLIERDEVNGFFEKIKLLESNLEALQVGIKSKI